MFEKMMNRFWSLGVVCVLLVTFAVTGNACVYFYRKFPKFLKINAPEHYSISTCVRSFTNLCGRAVKYF